MGPSPEQLDADTAVFDVLLHPHLPLLVPTVSHCFWDINCIRPVSYMTT